MVKVHTFLKQCLHDLHFGGTFTKPFTNLSAEVGLKGLVKVSSN
jgi:hypothetical protein